MVLKLLIAVPVLFLSYLSSLCSMYTNVSIFVVQRDIVQTKCGKCEACRAV